MGMKGWRWRDEEKKDKDDHNVALLTQSASLSWHCEEHGMDRGIRHDFQTSIWIFSEDLQVGENWEVKDRGLENYKQCNYKYNSLNRES